MRTSVAQELDGPEQKNATGAGGSVAITVKERYS